MSLGQCQDSISELLSQSAFNNLSRRRLDPPHISSLGMINHRLGLRSGNMKAGLVPRSQVLYFKSLALYWPEHSGLYRVVSLKLMGSSLLQ